MMILLGAICCRDRFCATRKNGTGGGGGSIGCVHMDGCCGYRRALVGIGRGIFSSLHKHSKKVLFSTCKGYISGSVVSCQSE